MSNTKSSGQARPIKDARAQRLEVCPSDVFEAIVETTSAAQFILEADRFIYANPAFEALTGYVWKELCSSDVFTFFAGCMPDAGHRIKSAIKEGRVGQSCFETELSAKSGDKRCSPRSETRRTGPI